MDKSPFQILPEDAAAVCASRGFKVIRSYLADNDSNRFCTRHSSGATALRDEFLLHRDIIHALVMPIVQLFNRSSALAEAALCSTKPDDLELAFLGDARGAFLSLQCFLSEEEEWCYTRGCPACTTIAALSTESHIRLLLASLLLSADVSSAPSTPEALTLPSFSFFLPALRNAVAADEFWGDSFWEHHSSRAQQLCTSLQDLMKQCSELEALVTSPVTSPVRTIAVPLSVGGQLDGKECKGDMKLRKSSIARRQSRLVKEEQMLLQRLTYQCWGAAALPQEVRREIRNRRPGHRRRSLTCP